MHQNTNSHLPTRRIPLWLKIAYTAFMAVLIPVYWAHYGPTNFLYFCDEKAQSFMPPTLYLATWLAALTGLVYIPTHHVLKRRFPKAA